MSRRPSSRRTAGRDPLAEMAGSSRQWPEDADDVFVSRDGSSGYRQLWEAQAADEDEPLPLSVHRSAECRRSSPSWHGPLPADLPGYLGAVHLMKGTKLLAVGESLLRGQGDDLLNHAYLKALERPGDHAHRDPNRTANWLHKTMRHEADKWRRRAARHAPLEAAAEMPARGLDDPTALEAEERLGSERALALLALYARERPAQVASLALYLLDFPAGEGAAQLGLSVRQYNRNLSKAKRAMAAVCDERGLRALLPPALLAAAGHKQTALADVGARVVETGHDGLVQAARGLWSSCLDGWHTLGLLARAIALSLAGLVTLAGVGVGGRVTGWSGDQARRAPPAASAPVPHHAAKPAVSHHRASRPARRATGVHAERVVRVAPRAHPRAPRQATAAERPPALAIRSPRPAARQAEPSRASVSVRATSHEAPSTEAGCRDIVCGVAP